MAIAWGCQSPPFHRPVCTLSAPALPGCIYDFSRGLVTIAPDRGDAIAYLGRVPIAAVDELAPDRRPQSLPRVEAVNSHAFTDAWQSGPLPVDGSAGRAAIAPCGGPEPTRIALAFRCH